VKNEVAKKSLESRAWRRQRSDIQEAHDERDLERRIYQAQVRTNHAGRGLERSLRRVTTHRVISNPTDPDRRARLSDVKSEMESLAAEMESVLARAEALRVKLQRLGPHA
jgi:hypothetical protein